VASILVFLAGGGAADGAEARICDGTVELRFGGTKECGCGWKLRVKWIYWKWMGQ